MVIFEVVEGLSCLNGIKTIARLHSQYGIAQSDEWFDHEDDVRIQEEFYQSVKATNEVCYTTYNYLDVSHVAIHKHKHYCVYELFLKSKEEFHYHFFVYDDVMGVQLKLSLE
jgi:hypothetical protein